jgi:predicted DsbA family dithiol-disulfide isomerase
MVEHHQPRMQIDVVSDAICPWCYIGKRQLELALVSLAQDGLDFIVRWNPFQLNPDMPRQGVERATYRASKFGSAERSRELDARVTAAAAAVGLDFQLERILLTPNTSDAHRLIWLAGRHGKQDALVETLFAAYFTEGRDIGNTAVLADCGAIAELDRDKVAAFLAGSEAAAEIRAAERAAREAGVSGVPSFLLDGYGLFSGAVPAREMAEILRRGYHILVNQAA